MYVVIGGAGEVGYQIARILYKEGYNVAIIEKDIEKNDRSRSLDALVISGNAAAPSKLKEAGIESADIFISVTGSDETNILSCAKAKPAGCRTIARVNSLDYISEPISNRLRSYGVDVALCPDLITSKKMARLLTMPSLMDVDIFANGRVQIIEARVRRNSLMVGKKLKDIHLPPSTDIISIYRDNAIRLPENTHRLLPDDRVVFILTDSRQMIPLEQLLAGPQTRKNLGNNIERVMIIGATRIGISLAKYLEQRVKVILVDSDKEACKAASEQLSNSLVILGDGTDEGTLKEENIDTIDAFVATTSNEDTNMFSCLLGKEFGAKKTIALINRPKLKSMFENIGIDIAVSPRMITVNSALQHIYQSEMLALSILHGGEAKILEMKPRSNSKVIGRPLKKIKFPHNVKIAAIVRGTQVALPKGNEMIKPGDRFIIFSMTESVPKVDRLLTKSGFMRS